MNEPIDVIGSSIAECAMAVSPRASSRTNARRVRDFIVNAAAEGSLTPGSRLPTERELAKRFAVPRNALRRTLAQLEAEGSITRHVGRGTFLAGVASSATLDFPAESFSHTSPAELM